MRRCPNRALIDDGDAGRVEPAFGEKPRRVAVIDERIGQSELQQRDDDAGGGERFGDRAAGAAGDDVLLDRDQRIVLARELAHELGVERLDEAHVGDRGVELFGGGERRADHAAERQDRDAVRAPRRRPAHLALADRQRGHRATRPATPGPVPRG